MKEYLESEGVCFGVDCIRSYSEIRKLTQSSVETCDQLLQVMHSRVKAEEAHASSLTAISDMPLAYTPGTLQDCMSQLQSDTKHKASQHLILAASLTEEVIQPITSLRSQMAKKELALFDQYSNMNNELKRLEDAYVKKSVQYEKVYQAALSSVSICRKHGISNEYFIQVADMEATEPQTTGLSTRWNTLTSLTSSTNILATKEKGRDWLNWAVSSASGAGSGAGAADSPSGLLSSTPVRDDDKKDMCATTSKALAKLEKYRVAARKAWLDFTVVSQRYAIKTQILLTKLQGMQESFILILQDHLRKIVVVESSFLANQQYDIQMLFKVMEDIDVREDMRQFILKNASTPLDLYASDGQEDEEDGSERDRLASRDTEEEGEHGADIAIDLGTNTPVHLSVCDESKNDSWSDVPWTSDIFNTFFSGAKKLNHIKELALPPCGDTMTFAQLRSILVERHLDALDKESSSTSTTIKHHCLEESRVRGLSRLSLVSRHIEKHNDLVVEGQVGPSLARLEIATSAQKKRSGVMFSPPPGHSEGSCVSPADDLLAHPLTTSDDAALGPLAGAHTPPRGSAEMATSRELVADEEEEEEELMTYGTAEEALEKMILLQTRMRQSWAGLIEEFAERKEVEMSQSGGTDAASGGVGDEEGRDGSSPQSDSTGADPLANNKNQSNEDLQTMSDGMLTRSLKAANDDQEENVDSAKCRDIMNSFGLLDAVSMEGEEGSRSRLEQPHSSLVRHLSPHSVQDLHVSTPVRKSSAGEVSDTPSDALGGGASLPFLSTSMSDYSVSSFRSPSSEGATPFTDQWSEEGGGARHPTSQYSQATPESLDFLSS